MLWFWLFVIPALILAALSLRGERKRAAWVAACMAELDEPATHPLPSVSLIVAVDQATAELGEALRTLAAQDYPDFELLVVASGSDSIPPGSLPSRVKVALSGARGRIPLLQAGVRMARRRSEAFVFASSSGAFSPLWLRALVAPLSAAQVGASTGFRWYTPDPPTFWSLLRSVWNAVIAERLGPGGNDFVWGGAMAISRDVFIQARVNESWSGAERDDVALVSAVGHSGRRIAFAPGGMVACSQRPAARQILRQARLEMNLARRYLPQLWWAGLLAHIVYCGAMVVAVIAIARGSRGAEWVLVAQFGLGMLKGLNRATLAKAELPQSATWFERYSWTHAFWVPLASWVWLYALISSTVTRTAAKPVAIQ